MTPLVGRLFDAVDARLGTAKAASLAANKVFPRHWSFLLGEVAVIAFAVLVATGVFLAMFYRPSIEAVTYTGSAELYAGRSLPAAFESVTRLSHDVPGGLLFRRVHRAAAHVFIISILLHLLRVVLTGAFRRPRELNYHLGVVLLFLAVASGYSGHNLVFDVLAGTSLRILYSFLLAIPFAGEAVARWVFAGEFPAGDFIPRLYLAHVLVLPALTTAAIAAHLGMLVRQTHTQFAVPGIDGERTVVGEPAWPGQAAKSLALAFGVVGLIALAAVLVPWSDVDLHGPYLLAQATNASQPDWFLFWVEGALRLYPGVDPTLLGVTLSAAFVSGVLLPLLLMGLLFAYPWVERTVARTTETVAHGTSAGRRDRHVLQNPLDVPFRLGFVTAVFTVLFVLTLSAGHDVVARVLGLPIETVTWVLRIAVLVLPVLLGVGADLYARRRNARRRARRRVPAGTVALLAGAALVAGCAPEAPSTLAASGPAARAIALVWWVMLALGLGVFAVVSVLLFVAARRPPPERGPRALVGAGNAFVAWWGVALPAVILFSLMVLHVWAGGQTYQPSRDPDLTVEVVGHKFWWEVRYPDAGVVTANEIRVPAGEPVRLRVESGDVIHAFWVPELHGKIDMVPGHVNDFWIEADEPGSYRGICAEYCGIQHAQMHFLVVAVQRSEFDAWLAERADGAAEVAEGTAARGEEVFAEANCIACHAVAGLREPTDAGPDLSDLAQRRTLAAGMLPNDREHLRDWILDPHASKPGVRMPATPLGEADLEALLDYLEGLR